MRIVTTILSSSIALLYSTLLMATPTGAVCVPGDDCIQVVFNIAAPQNPYACWGAITYSYYAQYDATHQQCVASSYIGSGCYNSEGNQPGGCIMGAAVSTPGLQNNGIMSLWSAGLYTVAVAALGTANAERAQCAQVSNMVGYLDPLSSSCNSPARTAFVSSSPDSIQLSVPAGGGSYNSNTTYINMNIQ